MAGQRRRGEPRSKLGGSVDPRKPRPPAFAQLEADPEQQQAGQADGEPPVEFVADETEMAPIVVAPEHAATMTRLRDRHEPPVVEFHQAERPFRTRMRERR